MRKGAGQFLYPALIVFLWTVLSAGFSGCEMESGYLDVIQQQINEEMGLGDLTTYAVTYDGNGNTGGEVPVDTQEYAGGDIVTILGNTGDLEKEGYVYTGWNTEDDGSGSSYSAGDIITIGSADVTLYAEWSGNVHTITFLKNDSAATGSMSIQSISEGDTTPLSACEFSKDGWSFIGWSTTPGGTVEYIDGANYTMGTSNVILYALWSLNAHTLTFDKNDTDATGTMSVLNISENNTVPLPDCKFLKTGWSFIGWSTDPGGAVEYTDGADYTMGLSDATLYAQWTINSYTITFDKQGGSGGTDSVPATYNSAMPTASAPARTGYSFGGYYTGVNGSGTQYYDAEMTGLRNWDRDSDTTLYAGWTIDVYDIAYELDGGTNSDSNPAAYTIETDAVILAEPAREGYTFGGWYSDSNFNTQVTGIPAGSTGNRTLYAKWVLTVYDITYELDGGTNSGSNPAAYTIETDAVTLSEPTKSSYIFGGWYSDSTFNAQITGIPAGSTGNRTLYAKWMPKDSVTAVISIPSEGQITFSETVEVTKGSILEVSVSEDTYESYAWLLDGTDLGVSTWVLNLDTTNVSAGNHTLSVEVEDAEGNWSSADVTISVTN